MEMKADINHWPRHRHRPSFWTCSKQNISWDATAVTSDSPWSKCTNFLKGCLFVHPFTKATVANWRVEFRSICAGCIQIAELVAVRHVSRQELQQPCRATLSALDVMLQAFAGIERSAATPFEANLKDQVCSTNVPKHSSRPISEWNLRAHLTDFNLGVTTSPRKNERVVLSTFSSLCSLNFRLQQLQSVRFFNPLCIQMLDVWAPCDGQSWFTLKRCSPDWLKGKSTRKTWMLLPILGASKAKVPFIRWELGLLFSSRRWEFRSPEGVLDQWQVGVLAL